MTPVRRPSARSSWMRRRVVSSARSRSKLAMSSPERSRERMDVFCGERRGVLVEKVVHLNEAPLPSGGLRGTRERRGAGMRTFVGIVPEDEGETIAERFAQPEEHAAETPAIRAEIVPVQHERDDVARCSTALNVVAGRVDLSQQSERRGPGRAVFVSHRS